jgi:hypothetical protein
MSSQIPNESIELLKRKKQAIELGIEVKQFMSLKDLEKEIAKKLDDGMKELKDIVEDINNI